MALPASSIQPRIGIGTFDREHSALLENVHELEAAVEGGKPQSATVPLLRKLADGIGEHFHAEEAMMAASKYPGLMLHAMKHQRLMEQLTAFRTRYSKDNAAMDMHSLNFLRDWFSTHIQKEDLNFGLWLNEHGKR
jgi:hemerythrin-like metal-binding protein